MSIILDGFVDSNLIVTEGYGETVIVSYVPVILDFTYDLSEIIRAKPSTPFTTEQIEAVLTKGVFIIESLPMKPIIGETLTVKLSEITTSYLDTSNILKTMGLKDINVWGMLDSEKSVIIKVGSFTSNVFSNWSKIVPGVSVAESALRPVIIGSKE